MKPLRLVTVTVDVPVMPASRMMLEGLAAMVKSTTVTVIGLVLWESEPIFAVTVTLNVPSDAAFRVNTDSPDPLIERAPRVASRPEDAVVERTTVPAKPFRGETVMVEVPIAPAVSLRERGLAETVKSTTFTLMKVVWIKGPLVPVTVTP